MKFTYEKDIKDSSSLNILYDELNDGDKNLFIINTPNQLLAAIEAQNHFKTTNNILLFYITKENDSKYIDKILSLIEFFPYSKAITYKAVKKRNYKSFLKLLNILAKINNYNYMFIGYSSIFYRRIVANVNYNKLYYLDSGMHTATIQEQILNDHNIQVKNPCKSFIKRKLKEKVLSFIYVLNGFKYESCLDDLNFFTIFNLAPYKNEKIVRHSFEYLKNILSVCKNSYMESFLNLTLANHNVNAYVNKKQIIIDQPISNKLITSSAGSILDIYPSELENIKDYQFELQSKLYSLEKDLYSNSLSSYNNYHKKLVNSFVFNDTIYFCKLFNELIDEFINKIEILTKMSIESVIVRFISILSNFDYMINIYGRFNRKLKNDKKLDVNEEILFKLFNLIFRSCKNINCDTKNRKLILKYLTSIYLSLIANFYNLNNLLDYVIKESQVFGNKLIEIIEFSYENKNDNYLCLDQLVCKLYNYYQNKYEVKNSSYCLYNFLRISVVLKKDIDYLKKDFLEKPISINNTREYFGILKIFLYSTDTDSKEIIKKIWSIYSKTIYSRIDRISSALTVVEYHYSQNRISKAKKLFSLITKNISSKNQDEAVLYLSMMQQLQFYKEYKELYESLYYQYIFNHFNKRNSTKNTLLFLENQIFLFKAKKDLEENYKFTKKLINLKYDKRIFKPGDTNTLYNNLKVGKYNCYFVSTPGQMLSAIEAQNYFKTTNNVLVILLFVIKDGKNINQMFKLSELFPYDKLITYQNKSSKFYVSFIPFLKQLTKDKVDYLFIGFNTILYRRIVANLNYKKLFYLDDGVHTITTHEDIYNDAHKNTRKEYIPFPKTLNLQKMKLIYGIHGLKVDTYLNDLNFFTVYNLEQYKNETIVKHDFSYIGSLLIKNHKINNVVYVLGQPLVNQVGVEQDIYTKYLKEVFEYYNDRKIIFVPHRLEIIYEEIETYISQRKNIEIFIPDAPIEFYFLNNSIYPRDVASFMTSALFNIRKLFPETKTRAFEIDLTKLDSHHQRGISLIYEHYRNEDVEIIELKEKYEKFISH